MQFLVIIALLVSLSAWVAHVYHRLSQLRYLVSRAWGRCRAAMKERNAALRELTYLLSLREESQDGTLQDLQRTEGDLSANLVHLDWVQLQYNEARLHQLLMSLRGDWTQPYEDALPSPLQQAYHLVMLYEEERRLCLARYNECVERYNKVLSLSSNRFIGGIFHFSPEGTLPAES